MKKKAEKLNYQKWKIIKFQEKKMKAGFGKFVINPPVGTSLCGYFNDRRSIDVRDDLYATCVVFDDGKNIFAVVSCDLVYVPEEISNKAKEILHKDTGIKKENVLIHATHTHTGPIVDLSESSVYSKGFYVEKSYLEILPFYIASSVKIALNRMEEVKIGVGKNTVDGISFNRRYFMKDGTVITNPLNQVENIIKPAGPVDKTVVFMKITDRDGNLKGMLVNFALHPDTLGDNLISSDWPGFLRQELKKKFGDIEIVFLNGPAGDINHLNPFDYETRGTSIGRKIAKKIAGKIKEKFPGIKEKEVKNLEPFYTKVNYNYRKITEKEYKQALKTIRSKKNPLSLKYMISLGIIDVYREKKKKKNIKVDISGFKMGESTVFIGLAGEVFAEIGIKIKEITGAENTIIAQNSNYHTGYIPSKRAFQQFEKNLRIKEIEDVNLSEAIGINTSYETLPMACKVGKNTEDKIISAVSKIFHKSS